MNLGTPEALMKMFLSVDGKKKNVALRHELKEQMILIQFITTDKAKTRRGGKVSVL